jgi:hypothetical protein
MKFIGWVLILLGAAAAVAGLLMTGVAPGASAADLSRLASKITLVLFGCGLGVAGAVFVVGAELKAWLSAIYDEVGGYDAAVPAPAKEETPKAEKPRAAKVRAEPNLERAEPVII